MTLTIEPNMQRREDLDKLLKFIAKTEDGATVSWLEIEQETGVSMRSDKGRDLFRHAMHKSRREYLPLPGSGVRFSDPKNALEIVRLRDSRISGAVKRSSKASSHVKRRHVDALSAEDRSEFLMRESLRGALLSGARSLKQLDHASEPPGPALPRDGNKTGVPFSLDRAKGIGSDLSDAYEETFDDD